MKMLEETLGNNLAKEVLTVLPYLDDSFVKSLPDELLLKLAYLAADATENYTLEKDKKLNEQNLSDDCKNFISLLYYQYSSSIKKEELLDNWLKNDNIYDG